MYYYRPRRSTHSGIPLSAEDTMRDNDQDHTTDAQESSCAPEEASDTQEASISDMQTLLLFLLLVDRLAIAQGTYTPDTEEAIVESEPPAARAEDTHPRSTRRRTFPLLLLALCIICSIAVITYYTVPLLTSSASVTIIPTEFTLTTTTTVTTTAGGPNAAQQQIPGRLLSFLTLTQARTVPTTGMGHQDARAAHGSVTFYNGLPTAQTIAAGMLLTGADGVQVVTDQDAVIPAATLTTPPLDGQATVAAHAVNVGPEGNIRVHDINGPCCRTYVLVQNVAAFTGGQDARTYPTVTQHDIDGAVSSLKANLGQSIQAALETQLTTAEALVTPVPCTPTVSSDHPAGTEATQITVTLAETCTGAAYDKDALQTQIVQRLTQEAAQQLGTGYALTGEIQTSILHATITDTQQGNATLKVQGQGVWAYQFSEERVQSMTKAIAGKSRQQATTLLLHMPGVSQVAIHVSGAGSPTLPANPSNIRVLVLYKPI